MWVDPGAKLGYMGCVRVRRWHRTRTRTSYVHKEVRMHEACAYAICMRSHVSAMYKRCNTTNTKNIQLQRYASCNQHVILCVYNKTLLAERTVLLQGSRKCFFAAFQIEYPEDLVQGQVGFPNMITTIIITLSR